jgi:hypothetical protein
VREVVYTYVTRVDHCILIYQFRRTPKLRCGRIFSYARMSLTFSQQLASLSSRSPRIGGFVRQPSLYPTRLFEPRLSSTDSPDLSLEPNSDSATIPLHDAPSLKASRGSEPKPAAVQRSHHSETREHIPTQVPQTPDAPCAIMAPSGGRVLHAEWVQHHGGAPQLRRPSLSDVALACERLASGLSFS